MLLVAILKTKKSFTLTPVYLANRTYVNMYSEGIIVSNTVYGIDQ